MNSTFQYHYMKRLRNVKPNSFVASLKEQKESYSLQNSTFIILFQQIWSITDIVTKLTASVRIEIRKQWIIDQKMNVTLSRMEQCVTFIDICICPNTPCNLSQVRCMNKTKHILYTYHQYVISPQSTRMMKMLPYFMLPRESLLI